MRNSGRDVEEVSLPAYCHLMVKTTCSSVQVFTGYSASTVFVLSGTSKVTVPVAFLPLARSAERMSSRKSVDLQA